ncbi:hypothetical protein EDD18DRAFT_1368798 [Armillaria luteobubalina]|uniref:Secreted protein n=1 Tax=Armillaria luteobubalina TaxID=153913 RepID=A0AA39TYG6_9AGAR|nr:hypothetical protein EDD18DRAFT_1368798 [Armillaria luteobubalina]
MTRAVVLVVSLSVTPATLTRTTTTQSHVDKSASKARAASFYYYKGAQYATTRVSAIWTRMRSNGMITTTNVKYSLLARLEEGKSLVGSSKTGSKTRKRAECARAHASVRTTNATARVLNAPLHRMPPARIVYIPASCPSPQVFRLLPYIKDLLP